MKDDKSTKVESSKDIAEAGGYWSELTNKILITGYLPDFLIRRGIRYQLTQRKNEFAKLTLEEQMKHKQEFVDDLKKSPIALIPKTVNEQHYEVPTEFYTLTLGKRKKYSGCLFSEGITSLDEAEEAMLALYCERMQLKPDMELLDLGCGWGSFSLYCAEKFPSVKITALSNSKTQKIYIDDEAKKRGFKNLEVITCDINDFDTKKRFDRIISVEMFEHMKNYELLMAKVASFLKPEIGKLFIHIFTHKDYPYHFTGDSWMAKYFFSGGTMPSDDLLLYFQRDLKIEKHWRVNGTHYGKTAEVWLQKTDEHKKKVLELFAQTYGKENAYKWYVMWRVFYMACAELWNFNKGEEWLVSHYLFNNATK